MASNRQAWNEVATAADDACAAFLARHGAYRDGELGASEAAAHAAHAAACAGCARYARVLAQGIDVLRQSEVMDLSDDFGARLQHRLFHIDDATSRPRRAYVPLAAAAMTFAALLLVSRMDAGREADAARLAVHAHEEVFGRTAQLWQPAALPLAPARGPVALPVALYSPVVVRAPQYGSGSVTFSD